MIPQRLCSFFQPVSALLLNLEGEISMTVTHVSCVIVLQKTACLRGVRTVPRFADGRTKNVCFVKDARVKKSFSQGF